MEVLLFQGRFVRRIAVNTRLRRKGGGIILPQMIRAPHRRAAVKMTVENELVGIQLRRRVRWRTRHWIRRMMTRTENIGVNLVPQGRLSEIKTSLDARRSAGTLRTQVWLNLDRPIRSLQRSSHTRPTAFGIITLAHRRDRSGSSRCGMKSLQ